MTHLFDPTLGLVSDRKPLNSLRLMSDYFHPTPAFNSLKDTLKTVHPTEYKLDWAAQNAKQRSERYRLNAWAHLSPLLNKAKDLELASDAGVKNSSASRPRLLRRFVLNWMLDWERQHSFDRQDPQGNGQDNPFAWYDMAVGLRAAVIGHMLALRSAGKIKISRPEHKRLLSCARGHLAYLRDPALWASHSNHGFYQSIGFFALVKSAPQTSDRASEDEELALGRLKDYLETCVSDDGVHLEHSPAYHMFVLKTLRTLSPLLGDKTETERLVAHILQKMEIAKDAMVTVEGLLLPFGDSNLVSVSPPREIDEPELFASFQAGLGVFKASQADSGETHYFATSAWHHSSVHKQLDDGGCVWFENGVPILTDPGRFGFRGQTDADSELRERGFFYDDPRRVFVESAHAHNTIEINGQTDNRRQAKPYGSGLVAAKILSNGTAFFEIDIIREAGAHHRRTWVYKPGSFLLCLDKLAPLLKNQVMTFDQWWQIDPIWELTPNEDTSFFTACINKGYPLDNKDQDFKDVKAGLVLAGLAEEDMKLDHCFTSGPVKSSNYSKSHFCMLHAVTNNVGESLNHRVSTYKGEVVKTGRMRGWTSRRPEHFEMAPTICINAKSDGKPVYMATVFSFDTSATNLSIVAKQPNGLTISWSSKNQENSDIRIEYEEEQILVSQNKYLKDTLKRILDPKNIEVQKIYRAQALNKNFQVEKIDPKIGLARIRELQASIRRSDKKIRYEEVLNELAVLEEAGIRSAAKLSGDILFAAEMSELDQKEGLQSYLRAAQKGHDGALKKLEEIRHETKLPENIERWLDSRGSQ